jgi:hypothetical protein
MSEKLIILISCLNLVIGKYISRKGVEDEFYSILNKEIMNHSAYDRFINCCLSAVEELRDSCLTCD